MPSISLPVASSRHRSSPASTSRLVNAMVEALPPDAKTPAVLVRAPGVSQWGTCGTGPIEGLHPDHGLLYAVSGGGFYSGTSAAAFTLRGAVGSSTEIDMASDTSNVVIVSPPLAYYWDGSSTFAQITDSDFTSRGAGNVRYQGSRFLFREPDTGRFFGSDSGSVTAYNALMFATAESASDELVGLEVDHEEVFLPGARTCEFWYNNGGSGYPYQRRENGVVELGCINGKTVAKGDNSLMLVASDYTVRRFDGYTPIRISTHAVEQWLQTVTVASLRGGFYSLEGHLVYVLTANEGAWLYDITSQQWHERATYGSEPAWNWGNPVAFAGKILVGSTTSNVIGELDPEYYYELGETLRMEWIYQPVYVEAARAFHDRLEMVIETGVGLTSGQGSAPEVMLSFSDDGGRTWFNLPNRSLGAIGNYRQRVFWAGLGSCDSQHGRVYRGAVSDPVRVGIVDTILSVRGGRL
jgi:hypothetical protein